MMPTYGPCTSECPRKGTGHPGCSPQTPALLFLAPCGPYRPPSGDVLTQAGLGLAVGFCQWKAPARAWRVDPENPGWFPFLAACLALVLELAWLAPAPRPWVTAPVLWPLPQL